MRMGFSPIVETKIFPFMFRNTVVMVRIAQAHSACASVPLAPRMRGHCLHPCHLPPAMADTTLSNNPLGMRKDKTGAYQQAEGTGSKAMWTKSAVQLHPKR